MTHSGRAKLQVLLSITALCWFPTACVGTHKAAETAASTPARIDKDQFESPAAAIGKLAEAGKHCFRTPVDVAAASARIAAYYVGKMRKYEEERRIADSGGPLPPVESARIGDVSDPDSNNCIVVSAYLYDDRYPRH